MRSLTLVDWGILEYQESLDRQRELVAQVQADECEDTLVFVEHPHVITLGRRFEARANIVAPQEVPIFEIERGGDVTYHGPGQLVAYPICKLGDTERDLHGFLRNMEEGIIRALGHFNLDSGRLAGKTGVWHQERKIASMGIACRRWVTFHGLALNVNTDLSYFQRINPCGFESAVMTSVSKELGGQPVLMTRVKRHLSQALAQALNRVLI